MSETTISHESQHWSIGRVAERTGLSEHALRFYEREGLLLHPVRRGPDGHRAYCDDDLEWLDLCIKLRSSGMPLAEIRRYTGLVREGAGNEHERLSVMRRHQRQVADQITQLNACLELITLKVKLYEDSAAQDRAGTAGSADPICPQPARMP
jgi:DNA-binding transcriptional MerR regulator